MVERILARRTAALKKVEWITAGKLYAEHAVKQANVMPADLWIPKTSSADRIDAKGAVNDALGSEGERIQAANSV